MFTTNKPTTGRTQPNIRPFIIIAVPASLQGWVHLWDGFICCYGVRAYVRADTSPPRVQSNNVVRLETTNNDDDGDDDEVHLIKNTTNTQQQNT